MGFSTVTTSLVGETVVVTLTSLVGATLVVTLTSLVGALTSLVGTSLVGALLIPSVFFTLLEGIAN
jgi:hypothetical protein